MKKLILSILSILIFINSYSTHLMGGQITVSHLNGYDYIVELNAYRDTVGINMASSANFSIYKQEIDTSGNLVWMFQFSHTVNQNSGTGGLMPNLSAYGVEVYSFSDTISLPGDGHYSIEWENCCRNGAIINMTDPLNESLFLSTNITVDSLNYSSSPTFLSPPVAYLPADTLWQYNPLPFDPDGDSLVWSLTTPLSNYGVNVNGYSFLSDSLYSNPSAPFALDSITGEVTWNPSMLGNFVASFLIEEFRNGVKIGEMRRDMQYIVVPPTINNAPMFPNSLPVNNMGYPFFQVYANQNFSLSILASDSDPYDIVSLSAFGEPILLHGASFSYNNTGNGNEIEGTFNWTPDNNMIRNNDYIMAFRASDGMFYFDETVLFNVSAPTSINNNSQNNDFDIYPNPLKDQLFISIDLNKKSKIKFAIFDLLGNKVFESKDIISESLQQVIYSKLNLSNGYYFVTLYKDNNPIGSKKIIINK